MVARYTPEPDVAEVVCSGLVRAISTRVPAGMVIAVGVAAALAGGGGVDWAGHNQQENTRVKPSQ